MDEPHLRRLCLAASPVVLMRALLLATTASATRLAGQATRHGLSSSTLAASHRAAGLASRLADDLDHLCPPLATRAVCSRPGDGGTIDFIAKCLLPSGRDASLVETVLNFSDPPIWWRQVIPGPDGALQLRVESRDGQGALSSHLLVLLHDEQGSVTGIARSRGTRAASTPACGAPTVSGLNIRVGIDSRRGAVYLHC